MNAIRNLAAVVLAVVGAHGQVAAQQMPPQPRKAPYEATFALGLLAFQNDTQLFAILDSDRVFNGILLASVDPAMAWLPPLPPLLANPVVLGFCFGEAAWTFGFPRVPAGIEVRLQGAAISTDGQLDATQVAIVSG